MTIKTKLQLGLLFLFGVIVLLGGMGMYYLNQLKEESANILTDNYESISYVQKMQESLDLNTQTDSLAMITFEKNLQQQEKNLTEKGEKEETIELRKVWNLYKTLNNTQFLPSIKAHLFEIATINQNAIFRKNEAAQMISQEALNYLKIITITCLLISFTFVINFPAYLASPIKQLTEGIRAITAKNYEQRLHFSSNDEFGELATAFNLMAQKLDEYEHSSLAQILSEKKRIEAIINKLNDAVIGLDDHQHILFVNSIALDLLHINQEELVGKSALDVALQSDLMRSLLNHSTDNQEIKIYTGGKESYFSKEWILVENEEKLLGKVIILQNITKYHELDAAKTNFIATISHELKTPISSIKMSLSLLENPKIGELNPEQQGLLQNIKDESQRLLGITGELLDLTQVESGKINLAFEAVSPIQIIDYASMAVGFQAQQKSIEFQIDLAPALPQVWADAEKTAWVLVNLLTNAIRYSEVQSKILISVVQEQNQVVFGVQDFGKGIDAKYLDRIFDKYFQAPNSPKGTGLGLAIAKQFIEAQQGQIQVKSEFGQGAIFQFSLPIYQG
ncbi:HAMP domain-containing protein [Emticicia sp. ODNR4P]|nr:HAMP domain-containing protein [Emticicia sp. ODNR4P]